MSEEQPERPGSLSIRINAVDGKVKVEYGMAVNWMDFTPSQARKVAYLLTSRAAAIDGISWDRKAWKSIKAVTGGENKNLRVQARAKSN